MTIDSLPVSAVANTSQSLLPLLIWAMAIGAAVLASLQRAGETARLRAELAELRESSAQAARAAGRAGRRTGPMFAALYQEQPDTGLGGSGAILATVAAALLGLAGGGLLWRDATGHGRAPVGAPAELARVQHTQDSLGAVVGQLHDSLRLVLATAKTETVPRAVASATRKPAPAATIPVVPPPPRFTPIGLGAGIQGGPDSSRHGKP
jgi:hypothetical protein